MASKKGSSSPAAETILSKNIFDILGLADLPKDQKAALLQKLLRIIYQRVIARIMDATPKDAMRDLTRAVRMEDEQGTTKVLRQNNLPSFETMMAEEALFMKHEMDLLSRGDAVLH